MDWIHPEVRAATIETNLRDIATEQLQDLFREVSTRVPSARLTKSGAAIIIQSADGDTQLVVTIPITGNNNLSLCSALIGNVVELQMSLSVLTTPRNGLIVCTAKPELHPISADKIVAWVQGI
jgi:hypothetical protein